MENTDKLYRSRIDKTIGGVCGGLADYFDIDVVLIRVIFVLLLLFGGGGFLIYIIMWIIIPAQPFDYSTPDYQNKNADNATSGKDNSEEAEIIYESKDNNTESKDNIRSKRQSNTGLYAGVILIFVGMIFLVDKLMPWFSFKEFWPLLFVLLGIILIKPDLFKPTKKQDHEI